MRGKEQWVCVLAGIVLHFTVKCKIVLMMKGRGERVWMWEMRLGNAVVYSSFSPKLGDIKLK
jgi:hypothetical protein